MHQSYGFSRVAPACKSPNVSLTQKCFRSNLQNEKWLPHPQSAVFIRPKGFLENFHITVCVCKIQKGAFSYWKERTTVRSQRSKKLPLSRTRRSFAHHGDEIRAFTRFIHSSALPLKENGLALKTRISWANTLVQFERRRTRRLSFVFFQYYAMKNAFWVHTKRCSWKLDKN
jgi:hypothetical protein